MVHVVTLTSHVGIWSRYRITPLKQKQTAKLILHTIMNGGVEASLDAEVILRLQEDNLDIVRLYYLCILCQPRLGFDEQV